MTATSALPAAASADHLTAALRKAGVLGAACVGNVAVMSSAKKLRSHTFRLRLDCDGPAGDAPGSVILKMGHLDSDGRSSYANRYEIAFYRDVAPALPERLVPRGFEAVDATDTSAWHLLLEDLTDSHFIATDWPLPPTLTQCEGIVGRWRASMPRGGTIPGWVFLWGVGAALMPLTSICEVSQSSLLALPIASAS